MAKPAYVVVLSTAPSAAAARKITRILLDRKLAACVNITSAVESHYVWKGKREKSREVLLIMKTRASLFGELSAAVRAAHPYETPEIIALPVLAGDKAYLGWVGAETKLRKK